LIEIICYTVCTTWLRLFLHEPNKNCDQSLKMFCWSFFVLLSFFDLRILIAPLVSSSFYCWSFFVLLSFFDLRILIAPLVSSNSYCRSLFVVLSFSLLVIALSVVQITVSDYPFGTFTLFFTGSTVHNIFCAQLH
jgi:hypothetical protein